MDTPVPRFLPGRGPQTNTAPEQLPPTDVTPEDWPELPDFLNRKLNPAKATGGATGLPPMPKSPGLPKQSLMVMRGAASSMAHRAGAGLLHSSVPGRTDNLNVNIRNGSYVIPADIVAGHGQGNTLAGAALMDKLFKSGPYGTSAPRISAPRPNIPKPMSFHSQGGGTSHVPVKAAGGEYIVPPEAVNKIGGGNQERGFRILDAFVLNSRKKQLKEIKGLKPPKKD